MSKVILMLLGTVLLFLAVRGLRAQRAKQKAGAAKDLKVGEAAPDFTLQDFRSRELKLASFRDRESVVLIFLRAFA